VTVFTIPGGPGAAQGANGGKVTGFSTLGNVTPVVVAAANPQRVSITFHNPGTNDVLVYPTTNASGGTLAPTVASPGGAFRVFGNGGSLTVTGECQQQWAALNVTTTGQPLTVMESQVQ
jgi:hypothetical protein